MEKDYDVINLRKAIAGAKREHILQGYYDTRKGYHRVQIVDNHTAQLVTKRGGHKTRVNLPLQKARLLYAAAPRHDDKICYTRDHGTHRVYIDVYPNRVKAEIETDDLIPLPKRIPKYLRYIQKKI